MALLVGTAGIPASTPKAGSVEGIKRVSELGLDLMELEYVRGVKMSEALAKEVKQTADSLNIARTVHAPYYINLNGDAKTVKASHKYILDSAKIGNIAGAKSVAIHSGYYSGGRPEDVIKAIVKEYSEIVKVLKQESNKIILAPEVTGKLAQWGTLPEILEVCQQVEQLAVCIDFSHLYARELGKANNSKAEWRAVLELVEKKIGKSALKALHIHLQDVQCNNGGEGSHLHLGDGQLKWRELLAVLKEFNVEGWLISEAPSPEIDAVKIKKELWK
ncbi:MAG: TIM barrel protein [DPANN group archaeon]|nr:TIM barrel protein [DPANN group archaeon]